MMSMYECVSVCVPRWVCVCMNVCMCESPCAEIHTHVGGVWGGSAPRSLWSPVLSCTACAAQRSDSGPFRKGPQSPICQHSQLVVRQSGKGARGLPGAPSAGRRMNGAQEVPASLPRSRASEPREEETGSWPRGSRSPVGGFPLWTVHLLVQVPGQSLGGGR